MRHFGREDWCRRRECGCICPWRTWRNPIGKNDRRSGTEQRSTGLTTLQQVAWSCVTVGAVPLGQCLPPDITIDRKAVAAETKDKAAKIIEAKGATAYGIAALTASICKSILFDQRNVRPIFHWSEEHGCCLSLPVVLGRKGIVRTLNIPLNDDERQMLNKSANALKGFIQEAGRSQKS
jgi:L-lactate dehydrogenase